MRNHRMILLRLLLGVLLCLLALACLAPPGCSTAHVRESYQQGGLGGEDEPAPRSHAEQKTVSRTVSATRIMSFAGTSPGETITHVKPMKVSEEGTDFGGMEPVEPAARGPVLLISAGILCVLAGGAVMLFVAGGRTIGLGVIGLGAVFIVSGMAFEAYPWAALVLLSLAALGAAAWFYFSVRSSNKVRQALQIVAAGIEQTPDNEQVKENISNAAGTRENRQVVKDVITDIKKKL